jgi:integrase
MVRQLCRLKALTVSRATRPGLYPDGGGLYLQVTSKGARSWIYRYTLRGKAREMGLGSLRDVSLANARTEVGVYQRQRAAGTDPIEARDAERARAATEAASAITFQSCAEAYIEAHKAGWRNSKHAAQWGSTLTNYAYPVFGESPVQRVGLAQIMRVLEPIWSVKPETASRLRGRIESVLDWSTTRDYRKGDNPARWRGHLENLLPKAARVRRVKHHPALPYSELGDFMRTLRSQEGTAALALEFTILTATRTSETIGARWDEIDLANALWVIPPERIKGGREHRVPLPPAALAVISRMKPLREAGGGFLFPGGRPGKPLSNMALLKVLERMESGDITVHGFRSTFRDWAAECTNFPRDVAEMALAHSIGDKVEAAYRRGDLFHKRRQLMQAWARHCATMKPAGEVVAIAAPK